MKILLSQLTSSHVVFLYSQHSEREKRKRLPPNRGSQSSQSARSLLQDGSQDGDPGSRDDQPGGSSVFRPDSALPEQPCQEPRSDQQGVRLGD